MSLARAFLDQSLTLLRGEWLPKIEAALAFLRGGGKRVVITDPAHVARAVAGDTGTHIIP